MDYGAGVEKFAAQRVHIEVLRLLAGAQSPLSRPSRPLSETAKAGVFLGHSGGAGQGVWQIGNKRRRAAFPARCLRVF